MDAVVIDVAKAMLFLVIGALAGTVLSARAVLTRAKRVRVFDFDDVGERRDVWRVLRLTSIEDADAVAAHAKTMYRQLSEHPIGSDGVLIRISTSNDLYRISAESDRGFLAQDQQHEFSNRHVLVKPSALFENCSFTSGVSWPAPRPPLKRIQFKPRWEIAFDDAEPSIRIRWSEPTRNGDHLYVRKFAATITGNMSAEAECNRLNESKLSPHSFDGYEQ